MDIKIYDFDFNLKCVAARYYSVNFDDYLAKTGSLEVHMPFDRDVIATLRGSRFLVMTFGGDAAVIVGYKLDSELIIYGRSLVWLLTKRTVPPFSQENPVEGIDTDGTLEELARSLAAYAFSDVENFELAEKSDISDTKAFWRNVRNIAFDVIADVCTLFSGGFRLDFDVVGKRWVFSCIKGKTLPYVVSEAHRNAAETSYTTDILDLIHGGYYDDISEDEEGERVVEERFVSRDDVPEGMARFEGLLGGNIASEAESSLAKSDVMEKIKATLRNLSYGVDYSMGDTVRIQIIKGSFCEMISRRVIGIKKSWDNGGYSEVPILEGE